MKKIAIVGAFGIGSVGDEAGLQAIVEAFKGHAKFTVLMRWPDPKYADTYGVKVCKKLEHETREMARGRIFNGLNAGDSPSIVENVLKVIQDSDLVLLGPGDFFNEDCVGVLRGALPEMAFMAWLCEWADVPYMIYAASARRLGGKYARAEAGWLMRRARIVTFRDRTSVRLLRESHDMSRAAILPDPVLMLRHNKVAKTGKLLVSVRSFAYKGQKEQAAYRNMVKTVVRDMRMPVLTIPMYASDDGYPDDRYEADMILPEAEHAPGPMTPQEAIDTVAGCSLALVTRLHAAVMCYICKVPFVAIAYEPKIVGFCEEVGALWVPPDAPPKVVTAALREAKPLRFKPVDMHGYVELIREAIG